MWRMLLERQGCPEGRAGTGKHRPAPATPWRAFPPNTRAVAGAIVAHGKPSCGIHGLGGQS